MNFAENLKQIRKQKHLSQEELAELLEVSRQAVSKWEQGYGYPEVEKLLLLSEKLHISLDYLMSTGFAPKTPTLPSGTILITSPYENAIVSCSSIVSSGKMYGGKSGPQYALLGIRHINNTSFWGEPTTFLGWYANKEEISKEISEIQDAILRGVSSYTLKYSAKTKRKWAKITIVNE